jgi:hypothetical protein
VDLEGDLKNFVFVNFACDLRGYVQNAKMCMLHDGARDDAVSTLNVHVRVCILSWCDHFRAFLDDH